MPSHVPGSQARFPHPDAQLPARILLRRHDGTGPTWALASKLVQSPNLHGKFGQSKTLPGVAFEVPQLPQGIYDAWYVDGHPTTARAPLNLASRRPMPRHLSRLRSRSSCDFGWSRQSLGGLPVLMLTLQ